MSKKVLGVFNIQVLVSFLAGGKTASKISAGTLIVDQVLKLQINLSSSIFLITKLPFLLGLYIYIYAAGTIYFILEEPRIFEI